ncbi:MAG: CpsB/CapC family capsule biosynthesis tyrosine phosphatase [Acidobacteriota bacterium]
MIDLHAHLLPDWDDGAANWDETLKMCEIAYEDGIRKIVFTPHLYRLNKYDDNLKILEDRMTEFKEITKKIPVEFFKGAEVFVHHEMVENIRKNDFTINLSNYIFVEFPSDYILPGVKDLFFNIMLGGFTPIISHPERNSVFMERPDLLFELIEMGSLAQVTAKSIIGGFGSEIKKFAKLLMVSNLVHIIASDAHDSERRPPRLSKGVEEAAKVVGEEKALAMVTSIPQAILDNKEIPDYGDPVNPVKGKSWRITVPKFLRKNVLIF